GGTALLLALGRRGLVGRPLDRVGVHLPFSTAGAVLAEAFVAMPFLVLTVEAGLRTSDRGLEEAARTLGAGRWAVFRSVTLPLVRPSLLAGGVLCWRWPPGQWGADKQPIVKSPMQGAIVRVDVQPGAAARVGQQLLVIESMKMEHVITADWSGVVQRVPVALGDTVHPGDALVVIEEAEVPSAEA